MILLERLYIAQLEAGMRQQIQILKQRIKANQYDVEANTALPKVKADYKEVSTILMAYSNIINVRLENTYQFKFQSLKVTALESNEVTNPEPSPKMEVTKDDEGLSDIPTPTEAEEIYKQK